MTAPIPVIQADIFTTRPFAGNPAAAVLDAERLDEAAMDDADVTGLSVVLSWLKPGTSRPGKQAVNETFALFVDKATLVDFLAKRVPPAEFTSRAKFTLFDGLESVGRVPLEVWDDSFNSTFKVANYEPPKGVQCQ